MLTDCNLLNMGSKIINVSRLGRLNSVTHLGWLGDPGHMGSMSLRSLPLSSLGS